MINFLPDTIKTFSNQSQQTVGSLIKSIKADKSQVAELVKNLSNFNAGADFAPATNKPRTLIESESFVDIFRDIQMRFAQYFDAANAINITTNSMVEIMLSQVSSIEKNIEYLENYIDNYDFISGKDDLYNYTFVENFDNSLRSAENESVKVSYVDRGGVAFEQNGNGYVDPIVSKFKIGSGINFINPIGLIKSTNIDSNYSQYISSISSADTLFNEKQSNFWNVSIKSPAILTSLPGFLSDYIDYDYTYVIGAKTFVEINLIKEIEMDVIRLNPNEFNGLQLMQVAIESANLAEMIYSANANVPSSGYQLKKLLNAPVQMKSTFDIVFPLDKVKRIVLIFNQPLYTKSVNRVATDETASRVISGLLGSIKAENKKVHNKLQDFVLEYFRKNISIDESKRNAYSYSDYYSYKYPVEENPNNRPAHDDFLNQKNNLNHLDEGNHLFSRNNLTNTVQNIVAQSLGSKFNLFNNSLFIDKRNYDKNPRLSRMTNSPNLMVNDSDNLWRRGIGQMVEDPQMPGSSFLDHIHLAVSDKTINCYEYSFSLKNIQFGKTNQVNNSTNSFNTSKSAFISSKVAIPGTGLGVKAKVNLDKNSGNFNLPNFDLQEANSYELSISFKENPISENDGLPIVSYDSNQINSEILFFDTISKTASLRFYPIETSIKIYCDQKLLTTGYSINKFNKSITINTLQPKSVYVVSYSVDDVNFSQDYIDLSLLGIANNISGSYTDNMNGEYFEKTNYGNTIRLENEPFVDLEKLSTATYSNSYGTVNTSAYQGYNPVSIKLNDGSYAINLTNYIQGNKNKTSFYSSSEVLFFQNGKDIIFNKEINQPFNVVYNYLNNYLRFRLIIRNNFNNYFSTGSVDNVIIKVKTKNLDTISNKLLGLG
jgi:hypothetical protein